MTDTILLKIFPKSNPIKVRLSCVLFGHKAYIKLGPVLVGGGCAHLAQELRRLADIIEPGNFKAKAQQRITKELSTAMASPETAWPWLVKNYPWIFDGINLDREPYAAYLRPGRDGAGADQRLQDDLQAIQDLQSPSLADISERLTGSRQYGGSTYTRVKKVYKKLLLLKKTSDYDENEREAA